MGVGGADDKEVMLPPVIYGAEFVISKLSIIETILVLFNILNVQLCLFVSLIPSRNIGKGSNSQIMVNISFLMKMVELCLVWGSMALCYLRQYLFI